MTSPDITALPETPPKMAQVSTSLPPWVVELLEIDAEPFEGNTAFVLRKIIVASYQARKPKDAS